MVIVHPEVRVGPGGEDRADTLTLTGHPNISLVIPGGSHGDIATASVVVNSIPVILAAPAGLRTARDLPIGFFSPNARPQSRLYNSSSLRCTLPIFLCGTFVTCNATRLT